MILRSQFLRAHARVRDSSMKLRLWNSTLSRRLMMLYVEMLTPGSVFGQSHYRVVQPAYWTDSNHNP